MGTPEFAVPSLDMLVNQGFEIAAVVTQPDKSKGRGKKLSPPAVKEYALSKGIPVIQPTKIKTPEFENQLRELQPDLFVTCAYGRILPENILKIPPFGCINVHGSLLPKYRGAAPLQWAIINGDQVTGITTMFTDIGMDTGDMLEKKEIRISEEMTAGELHDRMSILGAEVLKDTLKKLQEGTLVRTPQPHERATYAEMITKETGRIDWSKSSRSIHNLVRGTDPWPGAFSFYKGERMRVWKTEVTNEKTNHSAPGTICEVKKDGLMVATGDGLLKILELQFDSGKRMNIGTYLAGHRMNEGEILE